LIVDDEQDACDNLRDILGEFGYAVDTATSPLAALDLVEERPYDVALLDLRMHGLDGVELCRRIRERRSGTVRVIITAYADVADVKAAAAAGVYRVLPKPVDARLLLGLIEAVLQQPLVLVVDDDRELCRSLEDVLIDAGFRCGTASSMAELDRQLDGPVPQVFLIDLRLADEDGVSLLSKIGSRQPESRTILITAHHEEIASRMDEVVAAKATVCLKPFEMRDLIGRIRELSVRPQCES
jgi:DNA-binding NtrC family response regulator